MNISVIRYSAQLLNMKGEKCEEVRKEASDFVSSNGFERDWSDNDFVACNQWDYESYRDFGKRARN